MSENTPKRRPRMYELALEELYLPQEHAEGLSCVTLLTRRETAARILCGHLNEPGKTIVVDRIRTWLLHSDVLSAGPVYPHELMETIVRVLMAHAPNYYQDFLAGILAGLRDKEAKFFAMFRHTVTVDCQIPVLVPADRPA